MKKDKHPEYKEVLFVDSSTGEKFLIGSTLQVKETDTFEGKEYPSCKVPISSSSHPFFTKAEKFVDAEGRMEKFAKKYQRKAQEVKVSQEKQAEAKKVSVASKKKK